MASVRFPGGYTFDPETGELSGNGIPRPSRSGGGSRPSTRTNTSTRNSSYSRNSNLSLWDRFDNFIIGIGNWIASNGENAMSYIAMGCLGLAWIGFAIAIIVTWVQEGFLTALIAGVIGGGIMYLVSGIALAIFYFIDDFILLIVRYIFYNVYTFLVAVLLIFGGTFLELGEQLFSYFNEPDPVEQIIEVPASDANIYYCTASSSLNIRSAPRSDSYVVGSLKPGQEVNVYNFVDGFAKIEYNGSIAYASSSYLKKR